ncbi:MAG: S8 family serine peptidase [Saprospiraceae bacterium]
MPTPTHLYRGQHLIPLEKEPDFFTAILPSQQVAAEVSQMNEVQDLKRVFDKVYKIRTRDFQQEDVMAILRNSQRLECVCHHAYRPLGDPGTRYYLTDKIVLGFEQGLTIRQKEGVLERNGLKFLKSYDSLPDVYLLEVTLSAGKNPLKVCMDLTEQPEVRFAEPNLINRYESFHTPTDDLFRLQWHLRSKDDVELVAGADVGATQAWDIQKGSRDVIVGILDDGFDLFHPDFQGPGKVVGARDFADNDFSPDPSAAAGDFHGTPVAGVAIGEENGQGIVGAAPGCAFMPVRFNLSADDNMMFELFEYAGRRAHILSNSWGPVPVFSPLSSLQYEQMKTLVESGGPDGKGCTILFAAGNYNAPLLDMDNTAFEWRHPTQGIRVTRGAILNGYAAHPHVIAVAASNSLNKKSAYSNWGKEINVCAPSDNWHPLNPQVRLPGRGIWTTDNEASGLGFSIDSRYTGRFGGTSSATPLTAGVAALVKSTNPALTALEIKEILQNTADKITDTNPDPVLGQQKGTYDATGHSEWFGFGKVNAHQAVLAAQASLPTPAPIEAPGEEDPMPSPIATKAGAPIRIVAALVNPKGKETGAETISLLNVSDKDIDLDAWQIKDNRGRVDNIANVSIPSGVMLTFILNNVKLTNSGGNLQLISPDGQVVEAVSYTASDTPKEGWLVKF